MDALLSQTCGPASVPGGVSGALFGGVLQLLALSYCNISDTSMWPADKTSTLLNEKQEFDFIVVGAGISGSTVAGKLAECDYKVLLVEAGENPSADSAVPGLYVNLQASDANWQYRSEDDQRSCQGTIKQKCLINSGKALGGSGAIDNMIYSRGNAMDYNGWKRRGNLEWGYEDVLEAYKQAERLNDEYIKNDPILSEYHGYDGKLNVVQLNSDSPLKQTVKKGWRDLGVKYVKDVNGKSQVGISNAYGMIADGERSSAAKAYLVGLGDNLSVVKNAVVTKLLFDDEQTKVTGVLLSTKDAHDIEVGVCKEVIVSAGTINTPQLLMLSGIGPKDHLIKKKIPVVNNLPVGNNLQNHVFSPIFFSVQCSEPRQLSEKDNVRNSIDYFVDREGPLSGIGINDLLLYMDTTKEDPKVPDVQFVHDYYYINDERLSLTIKNLELNEEIAHLLLDLNSKTELLSISPTVLKPKSTGRVKLKSSDPWAKPVIISGNLKNEEDAKTLIRGIEVVKKLNETNTFKDAGLKLEQLDIQECSDMSSEDDEYWECYIRQLSFSSVNAAGTAKMGPKDDCTAVVDSRLKVHGIDGLRVVDSSIMPRIIRGDTSAASNMIGERAAQFIKEDWTSTGEVEDNHD